MEKNYRLFSFNILLSHYKKLKKISRCELVPMSYVINAAIKRYIEAERDAEIKRGISKLKPQ